MEVHAAAARCSFTPPACIFITLRVREVPYIFDGTDHVTKNIFHIYILSYGVS